jgi:hypothetical protein
MMRMPTGPVAGVLLVVLCAVAVWMAPGKVVSFIGWLAGLYVAGLLVLMAISLTAAACERWLEARRRGRAGPPFG